VPRRFDLVYQLDRYEPHFRWQRGLSLRAFSPKTMVLAVSPV
jgi:hypothetical protein